MLALMVGFGGVCGCAWVLQCWLFASRVNSFFALQDPKVRLCEAIFPKPTAALCWCNFFEIVHESRHGWGHRMWCCFTKNNDNAYKQTEQTCAVRCHWYGTPGKRLKGCRVEPEHTTPSCGLLTTPLSSGLWLRLRTPRTLAHSLTYSSLTHSLAHTNSPMSQEHDHGCHIISGSFFQGNFYKVLGGTSGASMAAVASEKLAHDGHRFVVRQNIPYAVASNDDEAAL